MIRFVQQISAILFAELDNLGKEEFNLLCKTRVSFSLFAWHGD